MPPLKTKLQLAKEQKASNARERLIAKQYLQSGPSILNLYNAFTHWYNSIPFLGGNPETGNVYITGEPAVLPGRSNGFDAKSIKSLQQALDEVPNDVFKLATGVEKSFFNGRLHAENMKKFFSQLWLRYIKNSTNVDITDSKTAQLLKQKLIKYLNSDKYKSRFGDTDEYKTVVANLLRAINNVKAYEYQQPIDGYMGYYDGNVMIENGLKNGGIMYPYLKNGVVGHELGHAASDAGRNLPLSVILHNKSIKPKLSQFGETNPNYYGRDDEIRTRFLNVAADAAEKGIPLDDVFILPSFDTNWHDVKNAYERSSAINYLNNFKLLLPVGIIGAGYGLYNAYDQ